jgi:quercetin dioxygenase-like cupin family protein
MNKSEIMSFINLKQTKPKEVVPGFFGRFYHSANMTIAHWEIRKGASIPVHQHVHEMVVNVIEGELQLTIDGETKVLGPGMVAVVPSNVPHTATGVTDCKVIDVFHPVRPEYTNQ